MNKWMILNISETEDKEIIKKAYLEQLSKNNPEDDSEGFLRLRSAYEEALKEIDDKEKDKNKENSPVELFIKRTNDVYNDFFKRCDEAAWKDLLTDDACVRLDMVDETEERLIVFLMDNYFLPKKIWQLLANTFEWESKEKDLKLNFPPAFIDFVMDSLSNEPVRYDLFTTADGNKAETHQYDRFIWLYNEIDALIGARNLDNEEYTKVKEEIEELPVKHPYYELQKARIHMVREQSKEALDITTSLLEKYPDDISIMISHGHALLSDKQAEKGLTHFEKMKGLDCDVRSKKNIIIGEIEARVGLSDYETAFEQVRDFLKENPYDAGALSVSWHIIGELLKIYEEKYAQNPDDEEVAFSLAKHYLNSNMLQECLSVLEKIKTPSENIKYYQYFAAVYSRLGEFDKSLDFYKTLLEKEKNKRNYAEFTSTLIAANKLEDAITYVDEAFKLDEVDTLSDSLLHENRGLGYFRLDKFNEALNALNEGLAVNDQDANLYVSKAWVHKAMGNFGEALDACERAIYLFPFMTDPYTIQMEIYNNAGMFEQMLDIAAWADRRGHNSPRVKYHKAGALRMLGQFDEAREIIKELLADEYDEGYRDFFYVEATHLAEAEGDWESAIANINKAIELNPEFTYRQVLLANTYNMSGAHKEALKILDRLIDETPDFIYAKLVRGDVYAGQKKYSQARKEFEEILEINNEEDQAYERIINSFVEEQKYDKAVDWATRRLELYENIHNYLDLAYLQACANMHEQSEKTYNTLNERFPESGVGYHLYGRYLSNLGKHEEAVPKFEISIEKEPEQASYVFEDYAFSLTELSRYEEALEALDKGEEVGYMNKGVIYMRKAIILEILCRYKESLDYLMKAADPESKLEGEWDMADVYNRIGLAYRSDFNDPENAMKYFNIALQRNPNSADVHENLGYMYLYHLKDYKEAIKQYDIAIKLRPDEPRTYMERGRAKAIKGSKFFAKRDFNKALELYKKLMAQEPSPCYNVYIAACYLGLGKLEQAKEEFLTRLDTPRRPGSWCERESCDSSLYGLGLIYELEKNYEEAKSYFEKAVAISNSVKHNAAIKRMEDILATK